MSSSVSCWLTCIGQFLHKDVKIDEDKWILLLSNKSPVPVKQGQVWGYMKQEMAAAAEGKLCWAAVRLWGGGVSSGLT